MAKTPYSLRSFKALVERESRRGKDISRSVPAVKRIVDDLRELRLTYKTKISRVGFRSPEYFKAREQYQEKRNELRQKRDAAVDKTLLTALSDFETALESKNFSLNLTFAAKLKDRQTYRVSEELDVGFPIKQAAAVIKDLSLPHSSSRNSIIRALKEAMSKKYKHAIYRLDIKEFFDSIPHEKLLERLSGRQQLDKITDYLIRQLLSDYSQLADGPTGVPQGVSLSSTLAEFYIGDFDRRIKAAPGVLFYARYVDDIIMVIEDETALASIKSETTKALEELGLAANQEKTASLLTGPNGDYPEGQYVEYLGYSFRRVDGTLKTGLTKKRIDRRVSRLQATFQAWLATSPKKDDPNEGHNGMLVDRIRYLTGNTKLLNSKDNVAIGLYFSNSALDEDAQELKDFDTQLSDFLDNHTDKMSPRLAERLHGFSFVEMFREWTFYRFSQRQVEHIIQCWREDAA